MNEYGDDGFADPDTDIDFEPEVETETEAAPVEVESTAGVYYLVDNGVIVETLSPNERWGRMLLPGQVVLHSSDFDG